MHGCDFGIRTPPALEEVVAYSMPQCVAFSPRWSGQVAYKMKTTVPKDYTIKHAPHSRRAQQHAPING